MKTTRKLSILALTVAAAIVMLSVNAGAFTFVIGSTPSNTADLAPGATQWNDYEYYNDDWKGVNINPSVLQFYTYFQYSSIDSPSSLTVKNNDKVTLAYNPVIPIEVYGGASLILAASQGGRVTADYGSSVTLNAGVSATVNGFTVISGSGNPITMAMGDELTISLGSGQGVTFNGCYFQGGAGGASLSVNSNGYIYAWGTLAQAEGTVCATTQSLTVQDIKAGSGSMTLYLNGPNTGTVTLQGGDALEVRGGSGYINVYGLLGGQMQALTVSSATVNASGTFDNVTVAAGGTLNLAAGSTINSPVDNRGTVNNRGTMNGTLTSSGTAAVFGGAVNADIVNSGTLTLAGGNARSTAATVGAVTGTGTLKIDGKGYGVKYNSFADTQAITRAADANTALQSVKVFTDQTMGYLQFGGYTDGAKGTAAALNTVESVGSETYFAAFVPRQAYDFGEIYYLTNSSDPVLYASVNGSSGTGTSALAGDNAGYLNPSVTPIRVESAGNPADGNWYNNLHYAQADSAAWNNAARILLADDIAADSGGDRLMGNSDAVAIPYGSDLQFDRSFTGQQTMTVCFDPDSSYPSTLLLNNTTVNALSNAESRACELKLYAGANLRLADGVHLMPQVRITAGGAADAGRVAVTEDKHFAATDGTYGDNGINNVGAGVIFASGTNACRGITVYTPLTAGDHGLVQISTTLNVKPADAGAYINSALYSRVDTDVTEPVNAQSEYGLTPPWLLLKKQTNAATARTDYNSASRGPLLPLDTNTLYLSLPAAEVGSYASGTGYNASIFSVFPTTGQAEVDKNYAFAASYDNDAGTAGSQTAASRKLLAETITVTTLDGLPMLTAGVSKTLQFATGSGLVRTRGGIQLNFAEKNDYAIRWDAYDGTSNLGATANTGLTFAVQPENDAYSYWVNLVPKDAETAFVSPYSETTYNGTIKTGAVTTGTTLTAAPAYETDSGNATTSVALENESIVLTAAVKNADGTAVPQGTVKFTVKKGTVTVQTPEAVVNSQGVATVTLSGGLSAGIYSITADYSDPARLYASQSAGINVYPVLEKTKAGSVTTAIHDSNILKVINGQTTLTTADKMISGTTYTLTVADSFERTYTYQLSGTVYTYTRIFTFGTDYNAVWKWNDTGAAAINTSETVTVASQLTKSFTPKADSYVVTAELVPLNTVLTGSASKNQQLDIYSSGRAASTLNFLESGSEAPNEALAAIYEGNSKTLKVQIGIGGSSSVPSATSAVTFYYGTDAAKYASITSADALDTSAEIAAAGLTKLDTRTVATDNTGTFATLNTSALPAAASPSAGKQQTVYIYAVYSGDSAFDPSFQKTTVPVRSSTADQNTIEIFKKNPNGGDVASSITGDPVNASARYGTLYGSSQITLQLGALATLDSTYSNSAQVRPSDLDGTCNTNAFSKLIAGTDYAVQWQYYENYDPAHVDANKWYDLATEAQATTLNLTPVNGTAYRAKITWQNTAKTAAQRLLAASSYSNVMLAAGGDTVTYVNAYAASTDRTAAGAGEHDYVLVGTSGSQVPYYISGTPALAGSANDTAVIEVRVTGGSTKPYGSVLLTYSINGGSPVTVKAPITNENYAVLDGSVNGSVKYALSNLEAGTYTFTASYTSSNGYRASVGTGTFIVRSQSSLALTAPADAIYSGAAYTVAPTVTGTADSAAAGRTVSCRYYKVDGSTETPVERPVDAGTYKAYAHLSETAYYTGADAEASFTIAPREIAIAGDGVVCQPKVYNGSAEAAFAKALQVQTVAVSNLVTGDSIYVTGTAALTSMTVGASNAAVFTATGIEGPDAGNYKLVDGGQYAMDNVAVSRNQITGAVSAASFASNAASKTPSIVLYDAYGRQLAAGEYTVTYYYHGQNGFQQTDDLAKTGTYTVIARPDQAYYKGGAAGTMTIAANDTAAVNPPAAVTAIPAEIRISNTQQVCTGSALTPTVKFYRDNEEVSGVTATIATAPGAVNDPGTYGVNVNAGGIGSATGRMQVIKKAGSVTVTAPAELVYSGTAKVAGTAGTYVSYTGGTIAGVGYDGAYDVGTYIASAHKDATVTETAADQSVEFSITRAPVTISIEPKTKAKSESNPILSWTATGFVNNESALHDFISQPVAVWPEESLLDNENNTVTSATYCSGAYASNYSFTYNNGSRTVTTDITQTALQLAVKPQGTLQHGDSFDLFTYGNQGKNVNGQTVTNDSSKISYKVYSSPGVEDNGSCAVVAADNGRSTLTIQGVSNFLIRIFRGEGDTQIVSDYITIQAQKRYTTITAAENQTKTYDEAALTPAGAAAANAAVTSPEPAGPGAGSYTLTYTVTNDLYQARPKTVLAAITPAAGTVKPVNSTDAVYGTAISPSGVSYTGTGLDAADFAADSVGAVTTAQDRSDAGSYGTFVYAVPANTNYSLTLEANTQTVNPAELTVEGGVQETAVTVCDAAIERVYGDDNDAMNVEAHAFVAGDSLAELTVIPETMLKEADETTFVTKITKIGTYTTAWKTAPASGNYSLADDLKAYIVKPAPLTIQVPEIHMAAGTAASAAQTEIGSKLTITGYKLNQALEDLDLRYTSPTGTLAAGSADILFTVGNANYTVGAQNVNGVARGGELLNVGVSPVIPLAASNGLLKVGDNAQVGYALTGSGVTFTVSKFNGADTADDQTAVSGVTYTLYKNGSPVPGLTDVNAVQGTDRRVFTASFAPALSAPASGTDTYTVSAALTPAMAITLTGNTLALSAPAPVGGGSIAANYTITVADTANGTITTSSTAADGAKITLTVKADSGYQLAGLTVRTAGGDTVACEGSGDVYTFTMPAADVTVSASFAKSSFRFTDVPEDAYCRSAVEWAVSRSITDGKTATLFDPDGICTRAQAVTFLWRAMGSPEPKSKVSPFTDVSAVAYYYEAVLWATEENVTAGTSDTTFSPEDTVTRAQAVTFLWHAAGKPAAGAVNPFTDVAAGAYYEDAVLWAVAQKITEGTGNAAFSPDDPCTRAQIVTFIWCWLGK